MKSRPRSHALLLITLTLPAIMNLSARQKEIIGYYPSWKRSTQSPWLSPEKIPFNKLTHINYAFFYPLPDGRLADRDTLGERIVLRGERLGPDRQGGTRLTDLAHQHDVKVLLSIGGWGDSGNFSAVAADREKRERFAHSCIDAIRTYGFDGIDVDWEYPGYADHNGTPADKNNCTVLLQTLRDSLDAYGKLVGKRILLTAALPASDEHASGFDMKKVPQILDRLNIMTYDFSGEWEPLSGHNAPLFSPRESDSTRNANAAFKLFTETYGVPPSKLNLGIPFYGHSFANCTSLFSSHAGPDTVHFSRSGIFYYDMVKTANVLTRYWDDRGKVPYAVSLSWKTLISYDDEESVALKAQYVIDHNAAGVIIWEITGDFLPDGRTPLLDVVTQKLLPAKGFK